MLLATNIRIHSILKFSIQQYYTLVDYTVYPKSISFIFNLQYSIPLFFHCILCIVFYSILFSLYSCSIFSHSFFIDFFVFYSIRFWISLYFFYCIVFFFWYPRFVTIALIVILKTTVCWWIAHSHVKNWLIVFVG